VLRNARVVSVAAVILAIAVAILVAGRPSEAAVWLAPVNISQASETGCSVPAVAAAPDGRAFVVYRRKNPDWRLIFRERSASGVWGPHEAFSVPWSERAAIAYHPDGSVWVFYAGAVSGGKTDLYQARRVNGVWTVTNMTGTADRDEDYARVRITPDGRVHLVYTEDKGIRYRVWNGSWSAPAVVGTCENPYYHRPDITVDSAGRVHIIWEESRRLLYRRFDGTSWSGTAVLGTTADFFAYGKIASGAAGLVVVTFDQVGNGVLKQCTSVDGGQTWTPLSQFTAGHYPNMAEGAAGRVHLIYQEIPGARRLLYRAWGTGGWSAAEAVVSGDLWKGWPSIAEGGGDSLHVAFDHSETLSYVAGSITVTPLPPVSDLQAVAADGTVRLTWRTPTDTRFQSSVVVYRPGSPPASPGDGTQIAQIAASPGAQSSFVHFGAPNGQTAGYSVFSRGIDGSYSAPASITAVPRKLSCTDAKLLADGSWTALRGKVVSALVPWEGAVNVQDEERASAIRLVGTLPSLAVGNRVDVSGTLETSVVNGVGCERQIRVEQVTVTGSAAPPVPLHMRSLEVVGSALPPYVPGARNGRGPHNLGLLVSLTGRVTAVVGQFFYVDDGLAVPDVPGRVGGMVRYPASTPPVTPGQLVTVTGVSRGSVPLGWQENRRLILMRTTADLVVH